jgi:hypothetical protein
LFKFCYGYSSDRKKKEKKNEKMIIKKKGLLQLYESQYLVRIHAVSNLAADRTDSRERSLERRRMELCIPPTLTTDVIING